MSNFEGNFRIDAWGIPMKLHSDKYDWTFLLIRQHWLSALRQLHLYSRLNLWLQWIKQTQLQAQKRFIKILGFGEPCIRYFAVDKHSFLLVAVRVEISRIPITLKSGQNNRHFADANLKFNIFYENSKFHWNLLARFQVKISYHWCRWWFAGPTYRLSRLRICLAVDFYSLACNLNGSA